MEDRLTVDLGDGHLEVEVSGHGEPVVVIQTALDSDELRPLSEYLARDNGFRVLHYHRRGYAGSSPTRGRASVAADAADTAALVRALGAAPIHVVGASYSGAVALHFAHSHPEMVHTLSVLEPPPSGTALDAEFQHVNHALLRRCETAGAQAALDEFMTRLVGSDWRETSAREQPGSVEALERGAATFFGWDVPALLTWRLGAEETARITCPVMYVGGDQSGRWFTEMRERVVQLLPHADEAAIPGAGHLLTTTHTSQAAEVLLAHLRRHPRNMQSRPECG